MWFFIHCPNGLYVTQLHYFTVFYGFYVLPLIVPFFTFVFGVLLSAFQQISIFDGFDHAKLRRPFICFLLWFFSGSFFKDKFIQVHRTFTSIDISSSGFFERLSVLFFSNNLLKIGPKFCWSDRNQREWLWKSVF